MHRRIRVAPICRLADTRSAGERSRLLDARPHGLHLVTWQGRSGHEGARDEFGIESLLSKAQSYLEGLRSTWRRRDLEEMLDDAELMQVAMRELIEAIKARALIR